MTDHRAPDKHGAARHVFGPRPIGVLVPGVTRAAFRKQSPAAAQLLSDWPQIVGPALATSAIPRRFQAGTLTLGCTGPVALELQHLAGPLMERINGHLGRPLVQRLRFVQVAGLGPRPPSPRRPRPEPVPIDGLPDSPLRDALSALGAALGATIADDAA